MFGIQRGMRGAQQHAAQIASAGQFRDDQPTNLVESLAGLRQDQLQVQASAAVVKAYDAMIGSLFDEKA
jgi:hypothetical protein